MKKHISIIAALATLIAAALMLASCDRQGSELSTTAGGAAAALTEQRLSQIAPELFKGAQDYYGYLALGSVKTVDFDYSALAAQDNGCKYAEVNERFKTVDELKAAAQEYYSSAYLEANLYTCFEGPYELYREIDGRLCLNVDAGGGGGYVYLSDTARLVSSDAQTATVTVDCFDNYNSEYTAEVTLKAIDGSWVIDALTYTDK